LKIWLLETPKPEKSVPIKVKPKIQIKFVATIIHLPALGLT